MSKQTPQTAKPVEAYTPPAAPAAVAGAPATTTETAGAPATTTETAGAPATVVAETAKTVAESGLTAEEAAVLAHAATVPTDAPEPKAPRKSHVVAARQATTTLRGILGEGEPVELRDFLNQQSFDKMVELGVIVPNKDE